MLRTSLCKRWAWGAWFLLLSGCASLVNQPLDSGVFYRRAIRLSVNGQQGVGVMVVPRASVFDISIETPGVMDLLTIETCAREIPVEGEKGLFGKTKKTYRFNFRPAPGVEDAPGCYLKFTGLEAGRGRHSWGLVDFQGSDSTLSAATLCNGEVGASAGVSICQAKVGYPQRLTFQEPVVMHTVSRCDGGKMDGNQFEYKMLPAECIYLFKGQVSGQLHRHTAVGYEDIVVEADL